jgi:glutamate synthase domain-containing protein 3
MKKTNLESKLNPFSELGEGKEPQRIETVTFEADKAVDRMVELYETTGLHKNQKYFIDALNPAQINIVLQKIIAKHPEEDMTRGKKGDFLNNLIQQSYKSGYNDFILNVQDTRIYGLGLHLKGVPENKMNITIQGNAGFEFGSGSKHCIYTIQGSTGDECGRFSTGCTFNVQGSTGEWCGWNSKHSTFNIKDETGSCTGRNSTNCTFTSLNKKTYEKMQKSVPRKKGNEVIYTGK